MPIRRKLLIVLLSISVIPLVVLGVLSYRAARNALRRDALFRLEVVADLKVRAMETLFNDIGTDLYIAQDLYDVKAHLPLVAAFADDRTQPEYRRSVFALNTMFRTFIVLKGYRDIVLADAEGHVVYRSANRLTDRLVDEFLHSFDPARFAHAPRGTYISQIVLDNDAGGAFSMMATAPVLDDEGAVIGLVTFNVPLERMYAFLQDTTGLGATGETLLGMLEGEQIMLLNPLRHDQEAALRRTLPMDAPEARPLQAALRGQTGSGISVDYRGEEVLAAWRSVPAANWGLVAKMDTREAFAPVRALQVSLLVGGLLVLVVVILVAVALAQSLSGPIRALQRGAEIIGLGDLTYRVASGARDEIGQLSRAFDHMVAEVRKKSEELTRVNKDLQTLLYVTSHDLREPLRGIENFTRIVHDDYAKQLDGEGRDMLQRTVAAAERMRRLLDDILALSRARRIEPPSEPVDSTLIVQDALGLLSNRIQQTGAVVRVAPGLPTYPLDKTWIRQAVYNLVANGLKFTREGTAPEIEIAPYVPDGAQRGEVGLVVRDRGPGVPAEWAERVFGLFQRAVGREVEGTGAGLAIVRMVAERHGGQAWVQAREGGGSEFIMTFGRAGSPGETA